MTEIRPCFAYNQNRLRCDMPGGHPGDHAITTTWTDEECYDPQQTVIYGTGPTVVVGGGGAYQNGPPPMDGDSDECLICDHPMHRGMCPVGECECRNGVPK
jgi:hypothetical protein